MNPHLASLLVAEVEYNSGLPGLRRLAAGQGSLKFPPGLDPAAMTAKLQDLAHERIAQLEAETN